MAQLKKKLNLKKCQIFSHYEGEGEGEGLGKVVNNCHVAKRCDGSMVEYSILNPERSWVQILAVLILRDPPLNDCLSDAITCGNN